MTALRNSAPAKLVAFAAALVALFGIALFAGAAVGPERDGASTEDHGGSSSAMGSTAGGHEMDEAATAPDPVRGLAVSGDGLKLALRTTSIEQGRPAELRFAILGSGGAPVRDFDVEHEKRMHLIVVRRDGAGFQHLHPELGSDGTWRVPLTLAEAGSYRVFADFSRAGEARTLATDLSVDGAADYKPLPEPVATADTADGYEVRIDAPTLQAGSEAELGFAVTKDGEPVEPEPYLGARGHLVALREGDLAYLHVHPDEDSLAFMSEFPTEGRYRLYLQFKHDGAVHTAEFTQDVSQ